MIYQRILLKLSGEALGDSETGLGLDPEAIVKIAAQIAAVANGGVEVGVVCGGGNILRGNLFSQSGTVRAEADAMGMLATVINGLALADALERAGVGARVLTAMEIERMAEPFVRRRALAHLEKGRVVVMAGGTGNPFFTTDTAAALRAVELDCQVLLKATKVDGVYTADPLLDPDARRIPELTHMDVLRDGLKVMDGTAITLCMDNNLPIIVFDLFKPGIIKRTLSGEVSGTLISRRA